MGFGVVPAAEQLGGWPGRWSLLRPSAGCGGRRTSGPGSGSRGGCSAGRVVRGAGADGRVSTRVARPISTGTDSGSRRTRLTVASQVSRLAVFPPTGPASVSTMPWPAGRVFQGMVTSTWGGRRRPFSSACWNRWQTSTSASARAWAGVRVSAGSRLAGSVRASRACQDDQATLRVQETVQMPAFPTSPSTDVQGPHPVQPFHLRLGLLAGRCSSSIRRAPGGPAGKKPPPPRPPGRLRLGRTVRGRAPAPAPAPSPGSPTSHRPRTPCGSRASPPALRATAIWLRHTGTGSPREGGQPLGGRDGNPSFAAASVRSASATQAAYWASARARSRASRCRPPPIAAGVLPAGSSASISHAQSASTHTPPEYHTTTTGKPPR